MRAAVVGHVEWVRFAQVERVPAQGEIVTALDTWEEPAGGGAVAVGELVRLGADVDFFVAKSAYDRACLSRAVSVDLAGAPLRVVTAEDLLIHKLIKLRSDRRRILQDLADMRAIVVARGAELDHAYLRTWLSADDAALLEAVRSLDDEALVQRVLAR